ncbi:glycine/betaine ABC transporter permease [Virgisporangium aliadipatigenens]|uniref:Glycine/betaine ABC transporter permease n=1 Tax=Virgisporangium aliadipatigenens TaxID=741659 RepID=A0A8J3YYD0_9ACTN|nr:ABC transporter permease [Virgisporangium aliadipatigenens]GIJ51833.1 glycine/betaine ABC transporter permease [Virgisporangium aliadipatigenens]
MNAFDQFVTWINDPLNWTNPGGILERLGEHLFIMFAALPLALVVAWPLGVSLGRSSRGGTAVVVLSNLTQAVPVMALLVILPLTALGFGKATVIVALAVFAVPPLLATAYTGLREIDPEVRDAAKGVGMSGWTRLWRVELPLAVPYLASGLRTAAVQVAATAALASFVNGGGLGQIIAAGFGLGLATGGGQVLAGGILVVGLALLVEGLGALLQRLVTPKGLRLSKL